MNFIRKKIVVLALIGAVFSCKQNENTKKKERQQPSKVEADSVEVVKKPTIEFHKSQVSPYSIEKTEKSQGRALGKNRRDYSEEEFLALPFYKRETYSVVVPLTISEKGLRNTLKSIVFKKTTADPDIDEIVILAYFKKNRVGKNNYTAGKLVWGPQGRLDNVKPKVAKNNIRRFYYSTIKMSDKVGNITKEEVPTDREWDIYMMMMADESFPLDDKELERKVMNRFNISSRDELYRIFYKVQEYQTF